MTAPPVAPRQAPAWPELALAAAVLVLAAVIAYQITLIRVAPIYAKVGPRLFPILIAAGLAAVGLVLLREAWRGGGAVTADAGPEDLRSGLVVAAGFLLQVVLYEPAGFIVAAAVGFVAVAFGFGSRRYARDAAVAVVVAVVIELVFARGLGLRLPKGVLEGLI